MVERGLPRCRKRKQRSIFPIGVVVVGGALLLALIIRTAPASGKVFKSIRINLAQEKCPRNPKADHHYSRGTPPKSEFASQSFFRRSSVRPGNVGVTLSVHLRIDQLRELRSLGSSWGSHLSAGVFISETQNSSLANSQLAELAEFHAAIEQDKSFDLDLGVVFGMVDISSPSASGEELYRHQYPVNSLKNVALAQVETDLVFLLDVDMVVTPDIWKDMLNAQKTSWGDALCEIRKNSPHGKIAGVVPLFDLIEGSPIPNNRSELIQLYKKRELVRFGGDRDRSQCGTDHGKWLMSDNSYFVDYHEDYAPIVIAQSSSLPWYPESIKGNISCRSAHTWYMAATGWEFLVLPLNFVVHPRNLELEKAEVGLDLDPDLLDFSRNVTREFRKQALSRPGVHDPIKMYSSKPRAYEPMPSMNARNAADNRQFKDELNC
ncbi:hypothetical protein BSKO_03159 [Bryopsis sp. KO-2023]|nr:hypothetical protein BSKO_03159 [Bryopsis sp. KO-2023]